MGRPIQVLSLMNKSRIAIKTGRIILLLSPEGHLMFYAPHWKARRGVPICRNHRSC
jgi:hypothetical protein